MAVVTVRAARAADAAAIADLWNRLIAETSVTFTTVAKDPAALDLSAAFVAEGGGAFAGFALAGPFRSGPGYADAREHSIHVMPAARGNGVGRALMAALEGSEAARGTAHLVAGISGENPGGVAFHARIGFVEVGRLPQIAQKFGRRMDLILMQKKLVRAS